MGILMTLGLYQKKRYATAPFSPYIPPSRLRLASNVRAPCWLECAFQLQNSMSLSVWVSFSGSVSF